ncbi:hypothetical protein M2347_003863 [Chryseobacterium sp. H1D6B]|uniref:hypothetical protein n=1 Tax=Chryseobacterium sp. H1D6B TaxID=2940588 RepID=UPI0015CD28B3|nr:hypothetical protein [Chryseobacterium sp. H1D6B]MDH6254136.1 hypothetical protein [Chryseobacterium sp. H1D6B]
MPVDHACKLIPMTSFVVEYYSNEGYADLQTLKLMVNYAQFLKNELTLDMFIPVDPDGNILKEPKNYSTWKSLDHNRKKTDDNDDHTGFEEYKSYQKAERKCLFEGFEIDYNGYAVLRIIASYNHSITLSFNKSDLMCQTLKDVESLSIFEEIYLSAVALKAIGIKNKF